MRLQDLANNQQRLFWVVQLSGWATWAAHLYLSVLIWGNDKRPDNYLFYLIGVAAIGALITLGLRALYKRLWERPMLTRAIAVLAGSYVAGLVWLTARTLIFNAVYLAGKNPTVDFEALFYRSYEAAMVMLVWSILYFAIKYYLISQREKQRYLKAISMAHEAQLKMLRYQLNPHFLFNTLNAISTLILDRDTELANSMVTKLSRFLRYSLVNDPMALVTVKEEVESLKLYLDIEKVRFAERLTLRFDVEPLAEEALMPSLLLQPLVENAIKYAISQSINGGYIAVSARVVGQELHLQVADDGPGIEQVAPGTEGSGVGINNCRERLVQRYGENQRFSLSRTDPHGLTIDIALPLTHGEDES